jgi:hypothetical protein
MRVVTDLDDVFLPQPRGLLVNLVEARPALETLLERLPEYFADTYATGSALGPALQAMFKMIVSAPVMPWVVTEPSHVVCDGWKGDGGIGEPSRRRRWCPQEPA